MQCPPFTHSPECHRDSSRTCWPRTRSLQSRGRRRGCGGRDNNRTRCPCNCSPPEKQKRVLRSRPSTITKKGLFDLQSRSKRLVPGFGNCHLKCCAAEEKTRRGHSKDCGTSLFSRACTSASITDLTGTSGDGDPVGAATVLVGVTGASPVVGPFGRSELIRAAAVIRGLPFDLSFLRRKMLQALW